MQLLINPLKWSQLKFNLGLKLFLAKGFFFIFWPTFNFYTSKQPHLYTNHSKHGSSFIPFVEFIELAHL